MSLLRKYKFSIIKERIATDCSDYLDYQLTQINL